jgi:hypothetical protein
MMDVLAEGPASQAGPELLRFRNIVTFNPQDTVVLHVQLERAAATTIKRACGADDFNIVFFLAGISIAHFFLPLVLLYL